MDKPISLPMHLAACDSGKDDVTDEYIVWISLSVYPCIWQRAIAVRTTLLMSILYG